MRLARAGYGAGDPERILAMKVSTVMQLLQYEQFVDEYQATYTELNREDR